MQRHHQQNHGHDKETPNTDPLAGPVFVWRFGTGRLELRFLSCRKTDQQTVCNYGVERFACSCKPWFQLCLDQNIHGNQINVKYGFSCFGKHLWDLVTVLDDHAPVLALHRSHFAGRTVVTAIRSWRKQKEPKAAVKLGLIPPSEQPQQAGSDTLCRMGHVLGWCCKTAAGVAMYPIIKGKELHDKSKDESAWICLIHTWSPRLLFWNVCLQTLTWWQHVPVNWSHARKTAPHLHRYCLPFSHSWTPTFVDHLHMTPIQALYKIKAPIWVNDWPKNLSFLCCSSKEEK